MFIFIKNVPIYPQCCLRDIGEKDIGSQKLNQNFDALKMRGVAAKHFDHSPYILEN